MRRFGIAICLSLYLASLSCSAGFAVTSDSLASRYEQRVLYQEAIDLIKAGRRQARVREIKDILVDYPLYPYIEYTEKIYNLSRQSPADIQSFVSRYADSPLADQLVENWIFIQAQQRHWSNVVNYYHDGLTDERNACSYAWALYQEDLKAEAFAAARQMWLVDQSQPDECDAIFKAWRDAGQLDRSAAWQRFALAMTAGETSLANYLTRYLDEADQGIANNFKLVQQNPNYVRQHDRFAADNDATREVIIYGVRRLATRDPQAAFKTFESFEATHAFTEADRADTWSYIGVRLALDNDPGNLLDSIPLALHELPDLAQARIRLALRQLDWSNVLVLINVLPPEVQQSSRWEYWKARVLAGSDDADDQVTSQAMFGKLAETRDFYGFLAADILGQDYQFRDTPRTIDPTEVLALEQNVGLQRALELFTLGEHYRGRREWDFATRVFSEHELQVAARVAQKWGWYRQAIRAMIDAGAWDDLAVRFPLAYQDSFVSNARTWDIPLHWSFAIARQESAFMPDARSRSGAMGIMQLMPATARLTAGWHDVTLGSTSELTDPILNIRLGSAYLGRMLRQFNNNRILASAAYNAGPGRVETWLDPTLPFDVWIETIPFSETRGYVQNVLIFSAIYARRLSQQQPMIYAHERKDFSNQQVTLNPVIQETAGAPALN